MYILVQDDSCHWFIISAADEGLWHKAIETENYEYLNQLVVQAIDGPSRIEFPTFHYKTR